MGWGEENMKLVMVDMKKAIAKCSHEDAQELSLPPYRSAYRFTNTMINKGNSYEHVNDMATMFAKMMYEMKNRNHNNYNTYSSNSHHGDSKMDKMRMMMKMMKMSNMMDDYPSSSYSSDDSAFDMFSDMFDSSDRMDNYRSSSDYKNPMGHVSVQEHVQLHALQEGCWRQPRPWRQAGCEAGRAEAPHGGQDRQHDLCHEGVERPGRQQQHRCAGHEEGRPEVLHAQRVVQEQVRAPA